MILNLYLSLPTSDPEYGARFDSVDSYVTWSDSLRYRQKISGKYVQDARVPFLFPETWDGGVLTTDEDIVAQKYNKRGTQVDRIGKWSGQDLVDSYNIRLQYVKQDQGQDSKIGNKVPRDKLQSKRGGKWVVDPDGKYPTVSEQLNGNIWCASDYSSVTPGNNWTDIDKHLNRIPFREMFINTKIIRDAFSDNDNVSDAIKQILLELNESSYGIFDLAITSLDITGDKLCIVDRNFTNQAISQKNSDGGQSTHTKDETGVDLVTPPVDNEFFNSLFIFKPQSKSSLVKNYNLQMNTPKNGIQAMVAIQNSSIGQTIFPMNALDDQNQSMRILNNIFGADPHYAENFEREKAQMGVRNLPSITGGAEKGEAAKAIAIKGFKNEHEQYLDQALGINGAFNSAIRVGGRFISTNAKKDMLTDNVFTDYLLEFKDVENEDGNWTNKEIIEDARQKFKTEDKDNPYKVLTYPEFLFAVQGIDYNRNFYVKTLEHYFELTARKEHMHINSPIELPLDITLDVYGIAGINPGDCFRTAYLPKQYREDTYFQTTQVSHTVDKSGWTTKIQAVMKSKPIPKDSRWYTVPEDIFFHPEFMYAIHPKILEYFKDFKIEEQYGGFDLPVFTATAIPGMSRTDKGFFSERGVQLGEDAWE